MTEAPGPDRRTVRRAAYKRGRGAEARAALLLRAKGYRIVARGFRCPAGEIVIARKAGYSACDIRFDAILISPWRWPRHIVDAWRPTGPD